MTAVRIPALTGGKASVRLVYADDQHQQVIGFDGPEWATAYAALDLSTAAAIELTPTADIATADGRATCYLITASASGGRGWTHCVQVLDSPAVVELRDLVGASAIDPGDIAAGLILTADERAAMDAANNPGAANPFVTLADLGDAGIPDAPLSGGPYGRLTGAWVEAVGPAGPTAVSTDAGNLAVLGTDGLLLVDAAHVTPAAIGAEPVMTSASQAEMEAGTEAGLRSMSPLRVAQAIVAKLTAGVVSFLQSFQVSAVHLGSVSGAQSIELAGGVTTLTMTGAVTLTNTLPSGAVEGRIYSRELLVTGAYAFSVSATNFTTTYTANGASPTFTPASGEFVPVTIRGWLVGSTGYRQIFVGGVQKSVTL